MVEYWAKAGLVFIGLVAATWVTIAYGMAYGRTRSGRYAVNALAYLVYSGVMVFYGYQFIQSGERHPSVVTIIVPHFLMLFQLVGLWFHLNPQPPYRHTRDILLFWRPLASQNDPDPARGLHVPAAPPTPLSAQTERRILVVVQIIGVAVIIASLTFILLT